MSQNWTPPAGGGAAAGGGGTPPPNFLIPAILAIFCCWPLAIPAIIFALQVNSKAAAGDMQGAMDASRKAKLFSFIGLGIGAVSIVIWLIFGGIAMITGGAR
jgi:hypothetical protein